VTPPADPTIAARLRAIFSMAPFIADLGAALDDFEPGRCVSSLTVAPRHTQMMGFVHAGVIATLADHTAGACAATLVGAGQGVLTSTFTLHLLRPAVGERLVCRATALRPGRTLTVVESEVFATTKDGERLVAKATVTLAIVAFPGALAARSP
jgi:uncharacterized protein (TIGR00369 family)